tara:strand:- start:851 stop:1519 length:669 start_codon:yes stop_codon:yes gene_type:complete
MATSGTNAFDLDVDEVIEESFERCGLNSRSGYDLKTARRSLNIMLAEWANRGINLWTVELRTQTLTADTTSYILGTDVIDVLEAVVFTENNTSTDIEVDRISRAEYLNISNKSTEGTPVQFFVERNSSAPVLYLYPTPDGAHSFKYYALTKMQDAGNYTNELEVPTRFLPCLVSGLAYYLSVKKSPERTPLLKQIYDEEWQRASEEDRPRSSFYAVPERGYI